MNMRQSYYPGDTPAETLGVVPLLDLQAYTTATGRAIRPDGTDAGAIGATIVVDELQLNLSAIVFDVPGVWQLRITAATPGGASRRIAPVLVVVQDEDSGWHTLDSARSTGWDDAIEMPDVQLWNLLETARGDVLEFAPVIAENDPVPLRYCAAQLMQARNRWNAGLANPANGDIGGDGFALTVFPLDWQVKQLLRPTTGIPAHS